MIFNECSATKKNMGSIGKKRVRKKTLESLKGALRGLIASNNASESVPGSQEVKPEKTRAAIPNNTSTRLRSPPPGETHEQGTQEHDNVVYIMSKESQLIPKLTEEQVMDRHKRADENMKRAWLQLIQKYEALEDQGDVLDLNTGEIVEDNGHVRSLSERNAAMSSDTKYVSVLSDLLEVDTTMDNVWGYSSESESQSGDENVGEDVSERSESAKASSG